MRAVVTRRLLVPLLALLFQVGQSQNALADRTVKKALACLQNDETNFDADIFVALTPDSCFRSDEYDVENDIYPFSMGLRLEELHCLKTIPEFAACSYCFMCHYFLFHGHSIAAYDSALLSLQRHPDAAPSLSCLAAVYYSVNHLYRAAFFASASYISNSSLQIYYPTIKNDGHIYEFMNEFHLEYLFPNFQNNDSVNSKDAKEESTFSHVIGAMKGAVDLYSVYFSFAKFLPRHFVGPQVSSYETFLGEFEREICSISTLSRKRHLCSKTSVIDFSVFDTLLPQSNWPLNKYLVLNAEYITGGSSSLLRFYLSGLSNALSRLGVPHKVVSQKNLETLNKSLAIELKNGLSTEDNMINNACKDLTDGSNRLRLVYKYIEWIIDYPVENCEYNVYTSTMPCSNQSKSNSQLSCDFDFSRIGTWDSSLTNIMRRLHPQCQSGGKYKNLVTTMAPEEEIFITAHMHNFAESYSPHIQQEVERDFDKAIDILVVGRQSLAQTDVYHSFVNMALQHNIAVKFYLNDESYDLEEENLLIRGSKVVVNVLYPECFNIPQVNSANLFKTTQLLALGKAVIIERANSLDESVLPKSMLFATGTELAKRALDLLNSPQDRWKLEAIALESSIGNHFNASLSSASKYDESSSVSSSVSLLSAALASLTEAFETSTEVVDSDIVNADSEEAVVRRERALQWASKYCQQNSLLYDTTLNQASGIFSLNNASQPCYRKTRLRIVMAYLKRRYKMSGKVLWVGCEKGRERFERLGNLQKEFKITCAFPSYLALVSMLKNRDQHSFDIIFINHDAAQFGMDEFRDMLPLLLKYLKTKSGIVMINSMFPIVGTHSDTWKLIIYLKSFSDIDCALGVFEGGILIIRSRPNPFILRDADDEMDAIFRERHFLQLPPSDFFFHVADRYLPMLDLYQLHDWLSLDRGTVKYTTIPPRKHCARSVYDYSVSKYPVPLCD